MCVVTVTKTLCNLSNAIVPKKPPTPQLSTIPYTIFTASNSKSWNETGEYDSVLHTPEKTRMSPAASVTIKERMYYVLEQSGS